MGDQARVRSLVKEADVYRTQGLLDESRQKYLEAIELIRKIPQFSGHEKAINAVESRIVSLDEELTRLDQAPVTRELAPELQELIKRTFSFSEDKSAGAIEGAIALAGFGQHERALAEFKKLLSNGTQTLVAAKNIIRCQLMLYSTDEAIRQFQEWLSGELLSTQQLKKIRSFLQQLLERKGVEAELPKVVEAASKRPVVTQKEEEAEEEEEDLLDISSVGVKLESGPRKGSIVDLEVTFQSGNVISLIISANDTDLLDNLEVGIHLKDVQLYSPMAIFTGNGTISGKTQIESGPKRGNFIVNVTIESTSG
jgi:tetratricopeptide (TPR) repeat protein